MQFQQFLSRLPGNELRVFMSFLEVKRAKTHKDIADFIIHVLEMDDEAFEISKDTWAGRLNLRFHLSEREAESLLGNFGKKYLTVMNLPKFWHTKLTENTVRKCLNWLCVNGYFKFCSREDYIKRIQKSLREYYAYFGIVNLKKYNSERLQWIYNQSIPPQNVKKLYSINLDVENDYLRFLSGDFRLSIPIITASEIYAQRPGRPRNERKEWGRPEKKKITALASSSRSHKPFGPASSPPSRR